MDVHARDVVEKLKKEGVSSAEEFSWTSQMRCCPDDSHLALGEIVGKIGTEQFSTRQFCTRQIVQVHNCPVQNCPFSYLGAKLSTCLLDAELSVLTILVPNYLGAKLPYHPWGGRL